MYANSSQTTFASRAAVAAVESSPVTCQRCKRRFANFVLEEIQGFAQLRCGDLLIPKIEANCIHCGWTFYWNIREKDVEKMAVVYGRLVAMYVPE